MVFSPFLQTFKGGGLQALSLPIFLFLGFGSSSFLGVFRAGSSFPSIRVSCDVFPLPRGFYAFQDVFFFPFVCGRDCFYVHDRYYRH
jgi:hypothetical protein